MPELRGDRNPEERYQCSEIFKTILNRSSCKAPAMLCSEPMDSLKLFGRAVSDLVGYEAFRETMSLGVKRGSHPRQERFEANESSQVESSSA